MTTEKIYYADSHLSEFEARCLSCTETKEGWEVILDRTAFYPLGGGQAADTGTLGTGRVLDTRERGEEIVHLCDGPLEAGCSVKGKIDYDARFLRMQQHTGEHIVSGILHRIYGCHNTGFHMNDTGIVIDFDAVIPAQRLPEIEAEANRALWENIPLRIYTPDPETLAKLSYRTKKALPWPVRIVEIPGYDICACCGTHVARTGEIGTIKLLSVIPFRGGVRMEMACGNRALDILNRAYDQNRQVSQAFSAQWQETGEAARKMNDLLSQYKFRITALERQIFAATAAGYAGTGDVVHFEAGLDNVAVRELADAIAQVCGGTAAVFSGSDDAGYAFCLVSRTDDLRQLGKDLTRSLKGRGGGKPDCQQGRLQSTREAIAAFFSRK